MPAHVPGLHHPQVVAELFHKAGFVATHQYLVEVASYLDAWADNPNMLALAQHLTKTLEKCSPTGD